MMKDQDFDDFVKELKVEVYKLQEPIKEDITSGEYQLLNVFRMKIDELAEKYGGKNLTK